MESTLPFQLAVTLFILFAVSRLLLRVHDRKISFGSFVFWLLIWIGALAIVYLPGPVSFVANIAGIGRGVDFLIYSSIGLLFYLQFRQYVGMNELDKKLSLLATHIAIEEGKDRRKKSR